MLTYFSSVLPELSQELLQPGSNKTNPPQLLTSSVPLLNITCVPSRSAPVPQATAFQKLGKTTHSLSWIKLKLSKQLAHLVSLSITPPPPPSQTDNIYTLPNTHPNVPPIYFIIQSKSKTLRLHGGAGSSTYLVGEGGGGASGSYSQLRPSTLCQLRRTIAQPSTPSMSKCVG